MRTLKRLMLLLCTLLLTAAGAMLPYAVSAMQDARVESAPETRQFDPVNLTLQKGGDVQETLLLLADSYSDLEWNGRTRLTGEKAADAAREALRILYTGGLYFLSPEAFGKDGLTVSVEPHMMVSMTESSISAIVWVCWVDQLPETWIFIDDDTGKMVRAFLFDTWMVSAAAASKTVIYDAGSGWEQDPEEMTKLAELWRETLSDYYGMELTFSESEVYSDYYSTRFKLRCGEGEIMLEILEDGTVYFNP